MAHITVGSMGTGAAIVGRDQTGGSKAGGVYNSNIVTGKENVVGNNTVTQETVEGLTRDVKENLKQQLNEGQTRFFEEQLQKTTTLEGFNTSLLRSLPALNKIKKAVCMIQVSGTGWGTGFLCEIQGTGIVFCSAGHNFGRILNEFAPAECLKHFVLHFGNEDGHLPPLQVSSPPARDCPMNLKEFLDRFDNVCGSISFEGKRILIQNGQKVDFNERHDVIGYPEDYCALLLEGANTKQTLDDLGLKSIICGQRDYLKYKHEGLVAIFGHPNIPEDDEKRPFRISFGAEKDPEKIEEFFSDSKHPNPVIRILKSMNPSFDEKTVANNYIFYDNDTVGGNSGSPVIGRGVKDEKDKALNQGYSIKGIHVRSFNAEKTNGAQNIEKILDWINLGRDFTDHAN